MIFLDESGLTTEMIRRYGRTMGGQQVDEGVPAGHWKTLTILGAIRLSGWVATMTIEAATDGDVFLSYGRVREGRPGRPGGRRKGLCGQPAESMIRSG
jgi:hypothetical protein